MREALEKGYSESIQELFFENGKEYKGQTITLQVTDACNLRCTYCYQIAKKDHMMTIDVAKKFLDDFILYPKKEKDPYDYLDIEKADSLVVDMIGGEAIMNMDVVEFITEYVLDNLLLTKSKLIDKVRFSIGSNGVLYFSERFQNYLKKYHRFVSYNVSIDGNKKLHDTCRLTVEGNGSYDDAIAAIQHYTQNYNMNLSTKFTLSPNNIIYLYEAMIDLIKVGYKDIFSNCVFEEGWDYDHAKIFYKQLKQIADYVLDNKIYNDIYISLFSKNSFSPMNPEENNNHCGGTGAMLAVDYKGDLYPCLRYHESSIPDNPMIVGNIYDGIAIKDDDHCKICDLKCITRRSQSTDECFNCSIGSGCAWCSAHNYQVFGTANKRTTYICCMHKARALANVYYWNKYFQQEDVNEYNKVFKNYLSDEEALKIIDQEELDMLKSLEYRDPKILIEYTNKQYNNSECPL